MPMPGDYVNEGAAAAEPRPDPETIAGLAALRQELVTERNAVAPYRTFDPMTIDDIFSHHPPSDLQAEAYELIRGAFRRCALSIAPLLPDGPGKTTAIRELKNAMMAANSAVALEGKF